MKKIDGTVVSETGLDEKLINKDLDEINSALDNSNKSLNETLARLTPSNINKNIHLQKDLKDTMNTLYKDQMEISSSMKKLSTEFNEKCACLKSNNTKIQNLEKSIQILNIIIKCKKIIRKFKIIQQQNTLNYDVQDLVYTLTNIEIYLNNEEYKNIEELQSDRAELANVKNGIIAIFHNLFTKKLYKEDSVLSEPAFILISNKCFETDLFNIFDSELNKLNILNLYSYDKTNWLNSADSVNNYLKFITKIRDLEKIIIESNPCYFNDSSNEAYSMYLWRKLCQMFKSLMQRNSSSIPVFARRNVEINFLLILRYLYEIENYHFLHINLLKEVKGSLVNLFTQAYENNYLNYLSSKQNSYITENFGKGSTSLIYISSIDPLLKEIQYELDLAFEINKSIFEFIVKRFYEFIEVLCTKIEKINSRDFHNTNPETGVNSFKTTIANIYLIITQINSFINKNISKNIIDCEKISNLHSDTIKRIEEIEDYIKSIILDPIKKLPELILKMLLPDYSQSSRVLVSKTNVSYIIADIRNNLLHWSKEYASLSSNKEKPQFDILNSFINKILSNALKSCLLSKIISKVHAKNLIHDIKGLASICENYYPIKKFEGDINLVTKLLEDFPDNSLSCLENIDTTKLRVEKYFIIYFLSGNINPQVNLSKGYYISIQELFYLLEGKADASEKNEAIKRLISENVDIPDEAKENLIQNLN